MTSQQTEVPALLRAIRAAHQRDGRKIARYFQPGLSDERIHRICEPLEKQYPPEWYDLYRTYNGVDPRDRLSLQETGVFANWYWFPLEEAAEQSAGLWKEDLVHGEICTLFGIGYYRLLWIGLSTTPNVEGNWPVICFLNELKEMPVAFDGIEPMLRTILAYYDKARGKDVDMRRNAYNEEVFRQCALEHNKTTNFWGDDRYERWPRYYKRDQQPNNP